jgi:hypothetical protein
VYHEVGTVERAQKMRRTGGSGAPHAARDLLWVPQGDQGKFNFLTGFYLPQSGPEFPVLAEGQRLHPAQLVELPLVFNYFASVNQS